LPPLKKRKKFAIDSSKKELYPLIAINLATGDRRNIEGSAFHGSSAQG
jgi:hypothetical protein